MAGSTMYKKVKPQGNIMVQVAQCITVSNVQYRATSTVMGSSVYLNLSLREAEWFIFGLNPINVLLGLPHQVYILFIMQHAAS